MALADSNKDTSNEPDVEAKLGSLNEEEKQEEAYLECWSILPRHWSGMVAYHFSCGCGEYEVTCRLQKHCSSVFTSKM